MSMDAKGQDEWECSRCTVVNSSTAQECEVCHERRGVYNPSSWQCTHCTVFNTDPYQCTTCDRLRQISEPHLAESKQTYSKKGDLVDLQPLEKVEKDQVPDMHNTDGSRTSSSYTEGGWCCSKKDCKHINDSGIYRCSRCNTVKPYLPSSPPLRTSHPAEAHAEGADLTIVHDQGADLSVAIPSCPWHACSDWDASEGTREKDTYPDLRSVRVSEALERKDESIITFPDDECRLVLLGKTGSGKTSTANTIIGLQRFEVSSGFSSTTKKCQRHRQIRFGVPVEVVDTPGLFDTSLDEAAIMKETARCVGIISPGPHAIVLVIRLGIRFTDEENKVVDKVRDIFGMQLLRYLVIVFTCGDILADDEAAASDDHSVSLKKILENSPAKLKQLVEMVNGRFVVFNNKATWEQTSSQVRQLLLTIKKLLSINGNKSYTTEKLLEVEKILKERELELAKELYGTTSKRSRSKEAQARGILRDELLDKSQLLDKIFEILKPVLHYILRRLADYLIFKVTKGCSIF